MNEPNYCPKCDMPLCVCGTVFQPETDANVERVRAKLHERMQRGLSKYGVTTERTDLDRLQWLQHAQEEAMDLAVYLERLIQEESKFSVERTLERLASTPEHTLSKRPEIRQP